MANEKPLGLDSLPCEFHKELWDVVVHDILYIYQ